MGRPLEELEERIGYRFRDRSLLERALTHRSRANETDPRGEHNERLEFLGDAVLSLAAAELLMERFPELAEGPLTKIKARLVSADHLGEVGQRIELGEFLLLGRIEEANEGRSKKSLIGNALEALIAAVRFDAGVAAARRLVRRLVLTDESIERAKANLDLDNAKSTLQERLQSAGKPLPEYRILSEEGPDHKKTFTVEIAVGDSLRSRGQGSTKRSAEQMAAARALEELERSKATPPDADT